MTKDVFRFRLSAMMFGQYLIMGCWIVTFSTYLMASPTKGGLHFLPSYTGWIYSTTALAGLISPIFVGLLADRLFAAEKLMGCLHLVAAVLLGLAGWWCMERQPLIAAAFRDGSPELGQLVRDTFWPLFGLMFGYSFCLITNLTLSNVVAFRNLHDPQHSFGGIRLYGTVGWIVAGIQLELFWNTVSAVPLFVAAAFSIVVGFFSFCLPNTPPSGKSKSLAEAFGLPALSMFRDRSFCVVILCSLGISAVQQFYGVYANLFLKQLQAPYPAALQTIAQVAEVICMSMFPLMIYRFGLKRTMIVGLLGWFLRNLLFATEALPVIIAVGLPLHGLSYAFFVMAASMFVDRRAPLNLRASAQGIFTFVSMGIGSLSGNALSAYVVKAETVGEAISWSQVWLVPTTMTAVILLIFLACFRDSSPSLVRSAVESR